MPHTQTVTGTSGDWTFTLPDNVFLKQNDSMTGLQLTPSTTAPLIVEIHYDQAAWRETHGMIAISVQEPADKTIDSSDGGLRGAVKFEFHNDLGAGITLNEGPYGALTFFINGPGDNLNDTQYHATYAHFHGITDGVFPGHRVDHSVVFGSGNPDAPNSTTVHGAIAPLSTETWGSFTMHQRQVPNDVDDFSILIYPPQGALSDADVAKLNDDQPDSLYYFTYRYAGTDTWYKGWMIEDNDAYAQGQVINGPHGSWTIDGETYLGYEAGDQMAIWNEGRVHVERYHDGASGQEFAAFRRDGNWQQGESSGYGGLGSEHDAFSNATGYHYFASDSPAVI